MKIVLFVQVLRYLYQIPPLPHQYNGNERNFIYSAHNIEILHLKFEQQHLFPVPITLDNL